MLFFSLILIYLLIFSFFFSKDGYLFDKEAILEYYITKKNEASRKMKEFEKQKRKDDVSK